MKHQYQPKKSVLAITAIAAAAIFAAPAFAQEKEPIRIGVPTALTGSVGAIGEQVRNIVQFAADEANANGGIDGRKVEVRILDTEGKPDLARRQAEKLALDGYVFLTGAITSGETLAIAPNLARWNALSIVTVSNADSITGEACDPRMFRTARYDTSDIATASEWIAARPEQKWALIATDIVWGQNVRDNLQKTLEANGKSLISQGFAPYGTSDYAPYIQAIKSANADMLWIALPGDGVVRFVQQAREFGLLDNMPAGGIGIMNDVNAEALGKLGDGIMGVIKYSSSVDTPANKAFVARWQEKFGRLPTNYEGEPYIGLQVLFQAIEKAGSVDPVAVAKAMSGGTFETILGSQLLRADDNQLVGPNFFGGYREVDGQWRPVVDVVVPSDAATPPPSGACVMKPL